MILGRVPTPLVWSCWSASVGICMAAGLRFGIFDLLAEGEKTADDLAAATGTNLAGMDSLLKALNGFGYLKRRDEYYSNTRVTRKWLLKSSPNSISESIRFIRQLSPLFDQLETSVRTGKTADLHHSGQPKEFWSAYMRGLAELADYIGPEVAGKVRLASPPKRLLDVGGGHGAYAAVFCQKYPGLQSDLLDLPEALVHAGEIVAQRSMTDRIIFRPGDLREIDWGQRYDVVLLFSILHNLQPQEAESSLVKAYEALEPGGTVAILDSEHIKSEGNLSSTAGFNELLFFLAGNTHTYPEATLRQWMTKAGFRGLRTRHLVAAPMAVLITGQKL